MLIINFKDLNVDSICYLNKPLKFVHEDGLVKIENPCKYNSEDTIEINIHYSGIPKDGLIIKKNKYGRKTFFADNWPNRAQKWFPCKDVLTDKATVSFNITAPDKYMVVANGKLIRRKNNLNNTSTTTYVETTEMSTYCMVFGAAEFDVIEDVNSEEIPITYWLYPEDYEDGINKFKRAYQMVKYFSSRFGEFPFSKLALVESSTIFGGMENAGAIFFTEESIGISSSFEWVVAHEIVHQWFGDYITESDWSHLWLSEGFATFFGFQFFEYADGKETYKKYLKSELEIYLKNESLHERSIIEEQQDLMELLNCNNYTKGGFVLHMLRMLIGNETFWEGISTFSKTYGGKNALTIDFQKVMENVYGESLEWFFKQWIYEPGIPYIDIEYSWDENSKRLKINIKQIQKTKIMRFPLEFEFRLNESQKQTFMINKDAQTFYINFDSEPNEIIVDPEIKLLAKINIYRQ